MGTTIGVNLAVHFASSQRWPEKWMYSLAAVNFLADCQQFGRNKIGRLVTKKSGEEMHVAELKIVNGPKQ